MKRCKHFSRGRTISNLDPQLINELRQTMGTIDSAINHFEQVVDPTLIDCYIYELKAAQLRYQFLLQRIKKQEI
ncbi:MAG: YaaL family protein [Clostridium sp.]